MLSLLGASVKDISVIRRLELAARFFPRTMPNYWDIVASFSVDSKEHRNSMTSEDAHTFMENLEVMDKDAITSDFDLVQEAMSVKRVGADDELGVVLISNREKCTTCESRLYVRSDRVSKVTIYDDRLGTLIGTHYTKYCRKKGCSFQQHYGYSTLGHRDEMKYDSDWSSLPYFMCTCETSISLDMLHRLDKEILIGQISYKQRSDIYNDIHGYMKKEDKRSVA